VDVAYYPCYHTSTINSQSVPNNYGKFVLKHRLPSITKEVIAKPLKYLTRNYVPTETDDIEKGVKKSSKNKSI
jgi:hypothetical protein